MSKKNDANTITLMNWLMVKAEKNQKRYIDAENFIINILKMPWYKKIFILNKLIIEFIKTIDEREKEY